MLLCSREAHLPNTFCLHTRDCQFPLCVDKVTTRPSLTKLTGSRSAKKADCLSPPSSRLARPHRRPRGKDRKAFSGSVATWEWVAGWVSGNRFQHLRERQREREREKVERGVASTARFYVLDIKFSIGLVWCVSVNFVLLTLKK